VSCSTDLSRAERLTDPIPGLAHVVDEAYVTRPDKGLLASCEHRRPQTVIPTPTQATAIPVTV